MRTRAWTTYSPFALLAVAAATVAAATIMEDAKGTGFAYRWVYGAWWFRLLWLSVAITSLRLVVAKRLWRKPAVMGLHISFAVILAGALLTALTGKQGRIHLRKGETTSEYALERKGEAPLSRQLPFGVRLDDFYVLCYPGTEAPMDYVSHVSIGGKPLTISMNRIAKVGSYRLYQSSYDEDMQGSTLSLNYDPWGIAVTYSGYALLSVSVLLLLFKPRKRRMPGIAALILLLTYPTLCRADGCPMRDSHGMERAQVVFCNRTVPFGAMAHEWMMKVYGADTYQGMDAVQVVTDVMRHPSRWLHEPIIRLGRGNYRTLASYVNPADSTLCGLGNDAAEDEKVAVVVMLMQGSLFKPLPPDVKPLSEARVDAELLYHKVDWTLWALAIALAVAAFVLAVRTITGYDGTGLRRTLASASTLFVLLQWALRWCVAGHVPLSNGYETLVFVSLCLQATAVAFPRLLVPAFGISAVLLGVAHLGVANPQITPLMPVLHSPWLSAHVSVIIASYSLLVLSIAERRLLRPAVCLLAVGIFLGAIWANVSWGTYWSWDPKESWALVTMLVYSLPLHHESLPWFRDIRHYRLYSVLALACLLMTYFGVNYLLGGMHSYGNS